MFQTASLIGFLLLVVDVAANPIGVGGPSASLSLTRSISSTSAHDLVKRDQARAEHLSSFGNAKQRRTDAGDSVSVTNTVFRYMANVSVGNPATFCE